jgi:hypothetical protein
MLKSSVRIARLFVLSVGIAATTAMAQPGTPRGGPAAHAAPVPHASPAPHISAPPAPHISAPQVAPQLAAPRIAPQMTAPRVVPQMAAPRVAPQQLGRPSGGPPPAAIVRAEPTSRTFAAPPHERSQLGGQGRPNLAQPNLRDNLVGQHREGGDSAAPSARIGRNATQQNLPAQNSQNQPSRIYQLPGGNRAASDRVLRNQFFADRSAARDPNARVLARDGMFGTSATPIATMLMLLIIVFVRHKLPELPATMSFRPAKPRARSRRA